MHLLSNSASGCGTIAVSRVKGHGTTLEHFYRRGSQVMLHPANAQYTPIQVTATQVQIQRVALVKYEY